MILYGASGHAKVIIDSCLSISQKVILLFDDNPSITKLDSIKVVNGYQTELFPDEELILAVGDNKLRQELSNKISHKFGIVCNAFSYISNSSVISEGTVVFAHAIIQPATMIGKHCIVNTKASIDHDCRIDSFVHIAPGATICGGVSVGEGAFVGAGSVVLPNIRIGKWAVIGAGSVVIKDVPDYAVIVGNPGKILKYNLIS